MKQDFTKGENEKMSMLALIEGCGLNLKELGLAESEPKRLNTARLKHDISQKIQHWNERTLFTLAGIKGLTLGDMNTLMMCCQHYDAHGSLDGINPYNPDVLQVLDKYTVERGEA